MVGVIDSFSQASAAAEALRVALHNTSFGEPEAAQVRALIAQIEDYIAPRLADAEAPLLAVVGGSTGSGKSTLVNGIVRENVSPSGAIRPTTRQPVLICHPEDEAYFHSSRVLPGLPREIGAPNPMAQTLRIVTTTFISPGLALLDAPDFDSIDDTNRQLSSQLLAAADLWIFVTTPARYADNLVWNFLKDAASRDIEVIVVLNRVDEDALATVPDDLRRLLKEQGLHGEVFVVPNAGHLEGLLPEELVAGLRGHLSTLATDAAARRAVAARTVAGALAKVAVGAEELAAAQDRRDEFARQLGATFDENYARAQEHVVDATSDGNLLRTEVMARWQDFVGTSDAFRTVERWYSAALDRVGSFFTGKPAPVREVETEIEAGLHAVLVDGADTAASRCWSHIGTSAPALRETLDPALQSSSADIEERSAQLVRQWQAHLMQTIQDTAGDKRKMARLVSLGLNAATVALMIVVFASTAGLTGSEIAIAGGSAVVGQKLLETIFGEENVRRMAKAAKDDLYARIGELYAQERARYDVVTDSFSSGTSGGELRAASASAKEAFRG